MDKKAKKILFKTYWTAQGWKEEKEITPDDFKYAKSKGLMFEPLSISLIELKSELNSLINRIGQEKIVKGFLSSLTNKRLDWRSAIASYFNAKLILTGNREFYRSDDIYEYKNEDLNVLNFERIKWGGVRYSDLIYNYLDLKLFEKEQITIPTNDDVKVFTNILDCIIFSKTGESPSKLRDKLKEVMQESKNSRNQMMEILGCCEILEAKSYDRPVSWRSNWHFVEYWRGGDEFNKKIVSNYFGKYLN